MKRTSRLLSAFLVALLLLPPQALAFDDASEAKEQQTEKTNGSGGHFRLVLDRR